ncbi:hypothetical protein M440DRAFT_1268289 [Trichoderma longibrachiatum ATCC 18648]|uniref:Uncharacterized protein n=1 Tax=Trichoderma longibrachiatum ATCC 18648 TaxID=983965 RepID=A0A2T4C0I5_TRILO|nr:hypothetical protein M440DRAFT_1268289 [Trichoderma longibrachiatum ATCC 18648]
MINSWFGYYRAANPLQYCITVLDLVDWMGVMDRGDVGFVSSRLFASWASATLPTRGAI